jgi:CHAT domain-containing protein
MASSKFVLDWFAGPSAQVEIISPPTNSDGTYQLRYIPPLRSTIRPPSDYRNLGPSEIDPLSAELDKLVPVFKSRGKTTAPQGVPPVDMLDQLRNIGELLYYLLLPQYIKADMRLSNLFLDIGIDQALLDFPWELMHDGDDFICLKHFVGRFVNASSGAVLSQMAPIVRPGSTVDKLRMLLISVPAPLARKDAQGQWVEFEELPEAEAETMAIYDALKDTDVELKTLIGKDATWNEATRILREPFNIIHFNGHAYFNENKPRASSLVLHNVDLTAGVIAGMLSKNVPTLCFVNACQTSKAGTWKKEQNVYSLASAFLETGAYFLGSSWPLSDMAAKIFAKTFYEQLIVHGCPFGAAIQSARKECKSQTSPENFGWAAYTFYGDPRLCFRKKEETN